MSSVYPPPLSSVDALLGQLPSFWYRVFPDASLRSMLAGQLQGLERVLTESDEAEQCVSRSDVPLYGVRPWQPMRFLSSDRRSVSLNYARYGDPYVYGSQIEYGQQTSQNVALPVGDVVHAPILVNRIISPDVMWLEGVDYSIDRDVGAIIFRQDPFSDVRIPVRQIIENGVAVDAECMLWARYARIERHYMWSQYGYLVGPKTESSEQYSSRVNLLLDSRVAGASYSTIRRLFALMADTPLAQGYETVERIVSSDQLYVVTDAHIYRYAPTATAVVAPGQSVQPDQELVDTLTFYEPGSSPWPPAFVRSLILDPSSANVFRQLIFENTEVSLEASGIPGQQILRFQLLGYPADIEQFWEWVDSFGPSRGWTLEQALRQDGPLPTTVNPAQLVGRFLSQNTLIVRIHRPQTLRASIVRYVRHMLPPGVQCWLFVEPGPLEDYYETGGIVESTGLGILAGDSGESPSEEVQVQEWTRVRLVKGTCVT